MTQNSEPPGRSDWDGAAYQARLDAMAEKGESMHGEVDFVERWWHSCGHDRPGSILDAGCGTGRVGLELKRRGWPVVGVDVDQSMLATAVALNPDIEWHAHDLVAPNFDLGRRFQVVIMAGNVPLFTPAGTVPALMAGAARHLAPGGSVICGFSLGRGVSVAEFDRAAAAAGLALTDRFSSWDGLGAVEADGEEGPDSVADYQVSIHRL